MKGAKNRRSKEEQSKCPFRSNSPISAPTEDDVAVYEEGEDEEEGEDDPVVQPEGEAPNAEATEARANTVTQSGQGQTTEPTRSP